MTVDYWVVFGFLGQLIFGTRFLVQWVCSERKKVSYIPLVFWYLSIAGGIILLIYAVKREDPVFIVGQASGLIVYIRNLILIHEHKKKAGDFSSF